MTLFFSAVLVAALALLAFAFGRGGAPRPAPPDPVPPRLPAPAWLAELTTGELAELCLRLLSRMGYTMLAQTVDPDSAEITATDDAAGHPHRVLLWATPHGAGCVGASALNRALDRAHDEGAGRVLVVAVAGFTPEAERQARALPLELYDGPALEALTHRQLPELDRHRAQHLPTDGPPPIDGHGPRAPV